MGTARVRKFALVVLVALTVSGLAAGSAWAWACQKPVLSVTKLTGNGTHNQTVNAGDPVEFTIKVSNGGPGTANNVSLHDPLPSGTKAGWSIKSQTKSGQCSISSGTLSCTGVDLASGASYSVDITAATDLADCAVYDNTATASSTNADSVMGEAKITCQKPSLAVTKLTGNGTHNQTVNAGDPVEFTIKVSNGGPGTAKSVSLSDPLPSGTKAGWSIKSQTNSGQCSISSGTLSCTGVDLASGASYGIDITAATDQADCTVYDNTATASSTNAGSPSGEAKITCQKPSLSVTKLAGNGQHSQTVNAGDPVEFTVLVSNTGPGTAKSVSLSDPLPSGTKAGWSIKSQTNSGQCSISSGTLSCTGVDLASGASYGIDITAATDQADCTVYDNTATASSTNTGSAMGEAKITCQKPNLSVKKLTGNGTHSQTVNAGDPVEFTIQVANAGPGTAKNVGLSDPLPAGTASLWVLKSQTNSGQCAITGALGSQTLNCGGVDLASGGSFSIDITSSTSLAACTVYDNIATASSDNAGSPSDEATITCQKPNLSVKKLTGNGTHSQTVNAGDPVEFTIQVANAGPGTAKNVGLSDPLPAGTASLWVLKSQTNSDQCTITGELGSQTLNCSGVDLASGDSYSVDITSSTDQADCTVYDNTATASSDNAGSPSDEATITCQSAQVAITKTPDHQAPVNAGDPVGFTVGIKNTGTGAATGVVLSDPLPAGSGSGVTWAIDTSVGTPNQFVLAGAKGSQTLSLASSTLPAGADYKVHITAQTSETECGTYDNTATLTTSNAGNPDPASAEESCAYRVDLAITKSGSPATQILGQGNITWTMVVTNNGPSTDTNVKVSDPMPAGNTYVSSTTTQGTCTGGAILNCDLGTMTAGQQVTITLVTTPSASGIQTNTATVSGDRPETNLANNVANASVEITQQIITPPCVLINSIKPGQLIVGRKTTLTIRLTQNHKAAAGFKVRIQGAGINVVTKRSNAKGVIKHSLKMKRKGILRFNPVGGSNGASCGAVRVGVRGPFTPPVTG